MAQSESIGKLAAALAKVQAALKPAIINKEANAGKFRYVYADLNSVYDSCRELLSSNGLAVVQMPTAPPDDFGPGVGLKTTLMHESGEWISDVYYLPINANAQNLAQEAGKYITYARRYALSATLGIVADEDNDAQTSQPQAAPKQQNGSGDMPAPPMPTQAMMKKFHTVGSKLYGDEWDDKRPEFVKMISQRRNGGSGPAVTSSKKLFRAEMQELIDGMAKKLADAQEEA